MAWQWLGLPVCPPLTVHFTFSHFTQKIQISETVKRGKIRDRQEMSTQVMQVANQAPRHHPFFGCTRGIWEGKVARKVRDASSYSITERH